MRLAWNMTNAARTGINQQFTVQSLNHLQSANTFAARCCAASHFRAAAAAAAVTAVAIVAVALIARLDLSSASISVVASGSSVSVFPTSERLGYDTVRLYPFSAQGRQVQQQQQEQQHEAFGRYRQAGGSILC